MDSPRYVGVKPRRGVEPYVWDTRDKCVRYKSKYWGRITKELDKLNRLWEWQQEKENERAAVMLAVKHAFAKTESLFISGELTASEMAIAQREIIVYREMRLKQIAASQMLGIPIPSKPPVRDIPARDIPF